MSQVIFVITSLCLLKLLTQRVLLRYHNKIIVPLDCKGCYLTSVQINSQNPIYLLCFNYQIK